jgi:PAS domain S-box-containing protein
MDEPMNWPSRVQHAIEGLHQSLQKRPPAVLTSLGMVAVLWIAVVDFWIGPNYSISLFYLLPVALVAWYGSPQGAVIVATTAGGGLFVADWISSASSLHSVGRYWNSFILLLTSGVSIVFLTLLRELQQRLRLAVQGRTALWRREIDERSRTQEALRQSEQRNSAIVEAAADGIIIIDTAGLIIEFNPAAERIFGYTRAAVLGRRMAEALVPPGVAADASPDLREFDVGDETPCSGRFDITAARANGESFPLEITLSPLSTSGQPLFAVFVRDLTEQRQAEASLRNSERTLRLKAEIIQISSRERREIGHELHDGLGQQLTGIAFRAKTLEEGLHTDGSPHTAHAAELVQLINHVINQTRSIARGLDPVRIEGNDLSAALCKLAAETQDMFGVNCRLQTNLEHCALPADVSIALYRIAQQALTNSIQHGRAKDITIELQTLDGHLILRVHDNGSGFNPAVTPQEGMGLRIMEYRARSLGGTLTVQSEPFQGAVIACRIPSSVLSGTPAGS